MAKEVGLTVKTVPEIIAAALAYGITLDY